MRRREFITLLGGAAAWPVTGRAQQAAMSVVGLLSGLQIPPYLVEAFRQGLGEIGYVERHNLTFEYRSQPARAHPARDPAAHARRGRVP
jgi:putative ABC transport system substrate-binding protein